MQQVDVGPHYNFQSGSQAWHLTADAAGLIFIGITAQTYPALLEELKRTFSAKCGEKVAASRESELTAACKSLFKKLCAKYDDLASIDQLNKTMAKVEGVKMIMQENIEIALQNCVSLEHIDKQAEDLQAQAGMFKTRAKVLRSKVWWKLCKMRLLIAFIIVGARAPPSARAFRAPPARRIAVIVPSRSSTAAQTTTTTRTMSAAHHLSGLLCGLSVLPLDPPSPVSAALVVGVVVVLACTILFDPLGRDCLFRKLALYGRGGAQMVVGKDKKWKKRRPDPARVDGSKDKRSKRVVFIRHGESEWNLVFNVGSKIWVPFKAVAALAGAGDVAAMADRDASVLATSNLRRAAQTVALGLRTRLEAHGDEKVHCLSALQEISTNIDTLSITPPHKPRSCRAARTRPTRRKIANGGVAFTLDRGTVGGENGEPSQIQYRVDPGSVVEVHLGFDTPAKKKAAKAAKKAAKKTN
ncbi:hypothetical protein JL721_12013 [Aureococcus anophagefferens]|nr:hypothetical protein JL721_12013 [Aureococcus anophagefferens]